MSRMKIAGVLAIGFVLALGSGYFWGAAGRWELAATVEDLRRDLAVARAREELLAARVELFTLNFGEAASRLAAAAAPLDEAAALFEGRDRVEAAASLREAARLAAEARRLAAAADQAANARSAEALAAIDRAAAR